MYSLLGYVRTGSKYRKAPKQQKAQGMERTDRRNEQECKQQSTEKGVSNKQQSTEKEREERERETSKEREEREREQQGKR